MQCLYSRTRPKVIYSFHTNNFAFVYLFFYWRSRKWRIDISWLRKEIARISIIETFLHAPTIYGVISASKKLTMSLFPFQRLFLSATKRLPNFFGQKSTTFNSYRSEATIWKRKSKIKKYKKKAKWIACPFLLTAGSLTFSALEPQSLTHKGPELRSWKTKK